MGYLDNINQKKRFGPSSTDGQDQFGRLEQPEDSFKPYTPSATLGGAEANQNIESMKFDSSPDVSQAATSGAAAGAMGGAASAGITMGGALLSSYLAQKAADERARRDRSVQIAQNQADGEQNSMKFLDSVYRGALR